jgi:hypothetical protein
MAKIKISQYDSTASNNTDINSIDIDEGCLPSGINNALRELMKHLKDFQSGTSGDDLTLTGQLQLNSTDSVKIPSGTTAQRDTSPVAGAIRYNSTLGIFEGYDGTYWSTIGGGATGSGGDTVFQENSREVTTDYTLTTDKSALSVGPIVINSGVTVTIPSGERWVII